VIYSLASPKRTDPRTGQVQQFRPEAGGQTYSNRTIELGLRKGVNVTLQRRAKVKSRHRRRDGGDDWRQWMNIAA